MARLLSMRVATVSAGVCLLLVLVLCPASAQTCGLSSGGVGYDFSSLSSRDLYGTDGSAGSNQDNFYIVRVCGAVADPACAAVSGGSMVCEHAFPAYNQVPNAGTISAPSSALCATHLYPLIPQYSSSQASTSWSLLNPSSGASGGFQMTSTSSSGCSTNTSQPVRVNINFLCAPLQTAPQSFYSVAIAGCTYNFTLYTSLACPTNTPAVTPITAPPAATSSSCGYGGVDLSSLAVDMNATDEAGRLYIVHPCGAISGISTQYCAYPNNAGQYPTQYPSACEVTGYCNPSAPHAPAASASVLPLLLLLISSLCIPSLCALTASLRRMPSVTGSRRRPPGTR